MRALLIAVMLALMVMPLAQAATQVIPVKAQGTGTAVLNPPDSFNNVTFNLVVPPFGYGGTPALNNVWTYDVKETVHKRGSTGSGDYSDNFFVTIRTTFNGTNEVKADIKYTKTNVLFSFPYWSAESSLYYNDALLCKDSWRLGFHRAIGDPHPWARFGFGLHTAFKITNQSSPTVTPYLIFQAGDDFRNVLCTEGGQSNTQPGGEFGGWNYWALEGLEFENVTSLNRAPNHFAGIIPQTQQTLVFDFNFLNRTQSEAEQATILAAEVCDGWSIFGFCMSITRAFDWVADKAKTVGDFFITYVPFGQALVVIIGVPLVSIVSFIQLLYSLFFLSGEGIGVGTSVMVLLTYFASWGCVAAAITGNPITIVTYPFYVFYGLGLLIVKMAQAFWWLLMKAWEGAVRLFQAILTLFPG